MRLTYTNAIRLASPPKKNRVGRPASVHECPLVSVSVREYPYVRNHSDGCYTSACVRNHRSAFDSQRCAHLVERFGDSSEVHAVRWRRRRRGPSFLVDAGGNLAPQRSEPSRSGSGCCISATNARTFSGVSTRRPSTSTETSSLVGSGASATSALNSSREYERTGSPMPTPYVEASSHSRACPPATRRRVQSCNVPPLERGRPRRRPTSPIGAPPAKALPSTLSRPSNIGRVAERIGAVLCGKVECRRRGYERTGRAVRLPFISEI